MPTDATVEPRVPLTRERVLRAASALADQIGIESLSMRKIGHELGVEAMSLYNHVAKKDDLLDGMIDLLVREIVVPSNEGDWRTAIRGSALSARALMLRHPWAPRLMASRPRSQMGPAMLRYMDAIIGCLRQAGFSYEMVHLAGQVIGSRLLGYIQKPFSSADRERVASAAVRPRREILAGEYPNLADMLSRTHYDDEVEFTLGLELILDGLERLRQIE
ncbi:MAG TPA: TetR/AcrR family transcriptional regulator C-terminal domain-containing protein [Ktedonobacterales bacterium]|nr:TetR/AcrR family transcriptional regulator C-terminal domain-containing protein [Ktedonobacterales bacterium]